MSVQSVIKLGASKAELNPSPIHPNWVLEGNPIARNQLLSVSADGNARSYIWDCTAGRFNWFYEADETVYVIEGGVILKDQAGSARRLSAGDTIFFPAGARAEWYVENYIRKFALIPRRCRGPWCWRGAAIGCSSGFWVPAAAVRMMRRWGCSKAAEKLSVRVAVIHHGQRRAHEDLQIQPQRPILEVVEVVLDTQMHLLDR